MELGTPNLASIIDKIALNVPVNNSDSDYIDEEGLRCCGVCGAKKECKIHIFGEDKTVPCICKCEIARQEAEEAERKRQELQKQIGKYRQMGFPDAEMQGWTFEHDDGANPKLTRAMRAYAEHFEEFKESGKGLLLYGSVGTGKTYAAASVANALIGKGYPCLVTNFARLANTLQGLFEGKQEYIDSLNKFDLLVIDDLSAERNTEYMQEQVFNIINARYNAGLPMIITTNLTGAELKNPDGISKERIYSRILERCHPIHVEGSDRRKSKLKDEHSKMRDILGV